MQFEKWARGGIWNWILGMFVKLQKTAVGFDTSVPTEQIGSHWTDFHEV